MRNVSNRPCSNRNRLLSLSRLAVLIAVILLAACNDVLQKREGVITAQTAKQIANDVLGGLKLAGGFAGIGFKEVNPGRFDNLRISVHIGRMNDGTPESDVVARPGKLDDVREDFDCFPDGTLHTTVDAVSPWRGTITLEFNNCVREGLRGETTLSGLQTIKITESEVIEDRKFVIHWTLAYDQLTFSYQDEQWISDGVVEYSRSWDAGVSKDRRLISSLELGHDGHVLTFVNTTHPGGVDTDPDGEAPISGSVTSSKYGPLSLSTKAGGELLITSTRDRSSVLVGELTNAGFELHVDEDGDGKVDATVTLPV